MKLRAAIIQSSYIPWKGYFDIIHDVDLFVFYDDVQFTKNDWRNRNKIKSQSGPHWLSIPTGQDIGRLIYEVTLPDPTWQKKHWKTLVQNYAKAPYFGLYEAFFREVYLEKTWTSLSDLNQFLTREIATSFLGIKTKFTDSRLYKPEGNRLDRLLDLLKKIGATSYVSGPAAKDYIDTKAFKSSKIELAYKDYTGYPEYPQFYPPFSHYVSILDLLFQTGPNAPDFIWNWRQVRGGENQSQPA